MVGINEQLGKGQGLVGILTMDADVFTGLERARQRLAQGGVEVEASCGGKYSSGRDQFVSRKGSEVLLDQITNEKILALGFLHA